MQGYFPGQNGNSNGQMEKNANQDEWQLLKSRHVINFHSFMNENKVQKSFQRGKCGITFKRMGVRLGSHLLENSECLKIVGYSKLLKICNSQPIIILKTGFLIKIECR